MLGSIQILKALWQEKRSGGMAGRYCSKGDMMTTRNVTSEYANRDRKKRRM
jgi:hypothetical protein